MRTDSSATLVRTVGLVAFALASLGCVTITRGPVPSSPPGPPPAPGASGPPKASAVATASPPGSPDTEPSASPIAAPPSGPAATGGARTSRPEATRTRRPTPSPSPVPRVGYIAFDDGVPFGSAVSAGVGETASASGVELTACDPGLLAEGVLACARALAEAGVDGVIGFQPFAELGPEVCDILGGVPMVGVSFPQGPCQAALAVLDERALGRLAGEAVGRFAEARWDCDVTAWVSLEGRAGEGASAERMEGYRDGFAEICPLDDELVRRLTGADRLATAEAQMGRLLTALPGRRIVTVGLNEDSVEGALRAARSAGRERDVWVSGIGADPSARISIACDRQYIASVAVFPERFGALVVPVLLGAMRGEDVPAVVDLPHALVTAENVRDVFPDLPACPG